MIVQHPVSQQLFGIPDGARGTRATLRAMAKIVRAYRTNPAVRGKARELVEVLPSKAFYDEVRALFYFVRDNIRYLGDVVETETLHTPDVILNYRQGDCDDFSVLLASLLESINHPARFIAVGFTAPGDFEHVYVEALVGNTWVPLDASVEDAEPGWSPPEAVSRMVEHI